MPGRRTLDPYVVLGVARDATPLQVARAHRHLAKRHHPDLHEGATDEAERMRTINEAWAILSNPSSRADYDRSHPTSAPPAGGHWGPSRSPIYPASPSSTRTWATWRATAAETRGRPADGPPARRGPGCPSNATPSTTGAAGANLPRFWLGRRPGGGAHHWAAAGGHRGGPAQHLTSGRGLPRAETVKFT